MAMNVKSAVVRHCDKTDADITLAYETYGDAKKPTVLMIQGLNTPMTGWDDDLISKLVSDGDFHVVRYDNRDVGRFTKFDHKKTPNVIRLALGKFAWGSQMPPYTLYEMAQDAIALLDHLKIKQANLFGISMGGMIAQTISIHFPTRVRSMTSIMSTTGAADLPEPPLWIKAWFLKAPKSSSFEHMSEFRVQMISEMLCTGGERPDQEWLQRRVKTGLEYTMYRLGTVRQVGAIKASGSREKELEKCKIPTLVLHGAKDRLVPVEHGYRTAAKLSNSKLIIVPEMGHYILPPLYGTLVNEVVRLSKRDDE